MIARLVRRSYLDWLWLRASLPFRWAHKPLCKRFRGDVIRVGTLSLCRSCVFLYAGLIASSAFCLMSPQTLQGILVHALVTMGVAVVVAFSNPRWYARRSRHVRDVLRFAAGALTILGLFCCFVRGTWIGLLAMLLLGAVWRWYCHMRSERKRDACHECPELGTDAICSGYARQAEIIRIYDEVASDYVARTLSVRCVRVPSK